MIKPLFNSQPIYFLLFLGFSLCMASPVKSAEHQEKIVWLCLDSRTSEKDNLDRFVPPTSPAESGLESYLVVVYISRVRSDRDNFTLKRDMLLVSNSFSTTSLKQVSPTSSTAFDMKERGWK